VVHFIDDNNNINFFWFVLYFIGNSCDDVDGTWKETLDSRHSGWVTRNRQAIKMLEGVKNGWSE
jgi:hypothetical protein